MCFDINEQPSNLKTMDMTMNNITEKVEEGPYWERLLADKTKQHWLKVLGVQYISTNIYCKSRNLPNTDKRNYSIDLR